MNFGGTHTLHAVAVSKKTRPGKNQLGGHQLDHSPRPASPLSTEDPCHEPALPLGLQTQGRAPSSSCHLSHCVAPSACLPLRPLELYRIAPGVMHSDPACAPLSSEDRLCRNTTVPSGLGFRSLPTCAGAGPVSSSSEPELSLAH